MKEKKNQVKFLSSFFFRSLKMTSVELTLSLTASNWDFNVKR